MGPGRLTGMNGDCLGRHRRRRHRFNGARSIDRDERPSTRTRARREDRFNGARSIDRDERQTVSGQRLPDRLASMGPGRLTGMNARIVPAAPPTALGFNGARSIDRDERSKRFNYWHTSRSFNGARSIDRDERRASFLACIGVIASMGPGPLTGMNVSRPRPCFVHSPRFNGARSIDRDERPNGQRRPPAPRSASMGPGRLTGMNEGPHPGPSGSGLLLQWGPVD